MKSLFKSISDKLNKMLYEKYNIKYHKFDLDFIYHTTIFIDDNLDKINEAYNIIKSELLPNELCVNKFIIGGSNSGLLYTYKVLKEIDIK